MTIGAKMSSGAEIRAADGNECLMNEKLIFQAIAQISLKMYCQVGR